MMKRQTVVSGLVMTPETVIILITLKMTQSKRGEKERKGDGDSKEETEIIVTEK